MSRSTRISAALLFLTTFVFAQEKAGELGSRVRLLSQTIQQNGAVARSTLIERSAALIDLMRKDPESALTAALSETELSRLSPTNASDVLEAWEDFSGELLIRVADDFERGTSTTEVRLKTENDNLEAHLVGLPADVACGVSVRARGIRVGGVIAARVESITRAAGACTTLGVQKVVVLLLHFQSSQLPSNVTAAYAQDVLFGATSVDKHWQESSYGKVSASGDVFGPFNLSADYNCNQRDLMRAHAIAAADATVNFTQYTRIVLVFPTAFPCGGGLGTVGCENVTSADGSFQASTAWLRADIFSPAGVGICSSVHEMGHGFGLSHASSLAFGSAPLGTMSAVGTHDEYGDRFSLMGLCFTFNTTTLLGHFAAPHKATLGWFAGSNQQTVQSPGTFTLAPSENNTTALQTIRVQRGVGTNRWLWVEYRQPIGYDATFSLLSTQVYSGAVIHYEDPAQTSFNGFTRLLDFTAAATPSNFNDPALAAGSSWSDPYSPLTLTVNSATGAGLNITVLYDTSCAVLSPPSASVGPSAISSSTSVIAPAGCSWTAVSNDPWITVTGGSSGSGNGTVFYSVLALPGSTSRAGSISIARQIFTINQTNSNLLPPTAVSVTPSSGSGSSRTFSFVYSDPNGFADLATIYFGFSPTLTFTGACYGRFDRNANALWLLNDAGNGFLGPVTPGAAGSTQNIQCTLNGPGSSVSGSGNNLTVNVALTFQSAFGGAKNVYLYADDNAALSSNWQQLGTWTVPGVANQPPTAGSVAPSSGSASSRTFGVVYSDPNGFADLATTYLGFSPTLTFTGACYSRFERNTNALWLLNDAGNGWLGPVTPGAAGSTQNTQCTVNGSGSSVAGSGNNLTVNVALTFQSAFGGAKNIYLYAFDNAGLSSNWQQRGTWTVPGVANQPPTAVSVTPSSGSGSSRTFSAVYSDPNGFADLATTYLGFSPTLTFTGACYSRYERNANVLWLLNDAGNGWLGPLTPGVAGSAQNTQCIINGVGSSVAGSGNNLTVNVALTFQSTFGGAKNIYLYAFDNAGLSSNWQQRGTWTVP